MFADCSSLLRQLVMVGFRVHLELVGDPDDMHVILPFLTQLRQSVKEVLLIISFEF